MTPSAVVDGFWRSGVAVRGDLGKDDGVDVGDRVSEGLRMCQLTHNLQCGGVKPASARRIAYQSPRLVALTHRRTRLRQPDAKAGFGCRQLGVPDRFWWRMRT